MQIMQQVTYDIFTYLQDDVLGFTQFFSVKNNYYRHINKRCDYRKYGNHSFPQFQTRLLAIVAPFILMISYVLES